MFQNSQHFFKETAFWAKLPCLINFLWPAAAMLRVHPFLGRIIGDKWISIRRESLWMIGRGYSGPFDSIIALCRRDGPLDKAGQLFVC